MREQAAAYRKTNLKEVVAFPVNTAPMHDLLLRIGIPPHIYGYEYILYALELLWFEPDLLHNVTKGLYIDIALHFHTNPSRVERSIRHAISVAWHHGDPELISQMFQNCIRPEKGVPTNTMFLARLYYYFINREYER